MVYLSALWWSLLNKSFIVISAKRLYSSISFATAGDTAIFISLKIVSVNGRRLGLLPYSVNGIL